MEFLLAAAECEKEASPAAVMVMESEAPGLAGRAPPLPGWAGGMCLMEFLPAAAETIQVAVDRAAASRLARAGLLYAIANLAGSPLVIDTRDWW